MQGGTRYLTARFEELTEESEQLRDSRDAMRDRGDELLTELERYREVYGELPAADDAEETREHMQAWAAGEETHRGEADG